MTKSIATQMRLYKLMTDMNNEKLLKKAKENTIKIKTKTKLNTEEFEVGQRVKVSNCIRIFNDSIFVKFQLLNKYSKGVKSKCGLSRTDCRLKVELL